MSKKLNRKVNDLFEKINLYLNKYILTKLNEKIISSIFLYRKYIYNKTFFSEIISQLSQFQYQLFLKTLLTYEIIVVIT